MAFGTVQDEGRDGSASSTQEHVAGLTRRRSVLRKAAGPAPVRLSWWRSLEGWVGNRNWRGGSGSHWRAPGSASTAWVLQTAWGVRGQMKVVWTRTKGNGGEANWSNDIREEGRVGVFSMLGCMKDWGGFLQDFRLHHTFYLLWVAVWKRCLCQNLFLRDAFGCCFAWFGVGIKKKKSQIISRNI